VCCDAGWVRTGCGESGDSNAYSYPDTVNPLCCKSWFGGDGNVYATCLRIV
jgi:hypothetical protein